MFELNDTTRWILGRPNFWCANIANALRAAGKKIPQKAEEEQAETIYWMLEMYEKHGDNWRDEGQKWLKAIGRRALLFKRFSSGEA